ncbi:MAG: SDR family NAD(P)-dependent oxidoreductase, partial [Alphaproteobacteria bacterium]|nr:SDR family NAD(P)-dependent oxidoreductase [Alphaproteobacteria bacterium]
PRDRGVIIQVGSALAYRAIPLQAAYCGAKHAIRGFTDALRAELIHDASNVAISMIELPAVNTPQFDWARTRLPREPRPVGPVVQPEVIADAIYRASLDPKREYWIGRSTLEVILGNMALPALFDRLLARRAYEGQMTRVPALPHQRDNLEQPVHDLHRTRGSFGREATRHALLVPGPVARAGAAVLTAAVMLLAGASAARLLERRNRRVG